MSERTFDRISGLRLRIERYGLERREQPVSSGFTRVTTTVHLQGAGETGLGEDVTYDAPDHDKLQQFGAKLDLAGEFTLAGFSSRLEELELFPEPPEREASLDYRRWAFESAALDLALRQAGRTLGAALGREPRPLRFLASIRLGDPPSLEPIRQLLRRRPELRFKLDPTSTWDDALIAALARADVVEAVDFKGCYRGTPVDQPSDAALYLRVIEGLPGVWIEDPVLDDETRPLFERCRERVTWDAPIHSVDDIEGLPFPPRMLNFKPCRFGTLARLLDAYDHCAARGIGIYGGGQFELGPGRGQIQYLASLFHADAPNDVAPRAYHDPDRASELPASPLAPSPASSGFRWHDG